MSFPDHNSGCWFPPNFCSQLNFEFSTVSTPFDFPKEEEKVIAFWREIDAFQTSLKLSEGRPEFSFYDGPPFATGLPHYGHLLAGTIKASQL
jgi:isoleucyl-tRNA synthetase